jgi:hypothetical protein
MFETYPKGSVHPSSKVGEQDGKPIWPDGSKTSYGNTSVKDTVYNGDRCQTKRCEGGSGGANGPDYKPSRTKFGSEIHVGK